MKNTNNGDGQTPLLVTRKRKGKNMEIANEIKTQLLFALPMILTNMFYYLVHIVSVMFAGHLGKLELAGATLANSWATVTGFASTVGLSCALETLCGQGFGARSYELLGIYLQASCIVTLIFSIIIAILWWFTEPILNLLHQDPQVSKETAIYMRFLIPGIFAYGLLQNILRFLQTQSIVYLLTVFSFVPLLLHIGLSYVLVHCTSLGYRGAALANSITTWFSVIILVIYVNYSKKFEQTWKGLSMESLNYVFVDLKFALPSAAMVCLELWAFEVLVLFAGLMPDSEKSTSLTAICVNTEAFAFMFTYGLAAAASTRVSNELGAGNVNQAKHAMSVALKLSIILAIIVLVSLGFGHDIWAGLFSGSASMMKAYGSMIILVCISTFFDTIQGVLSGVCRGCGWQQLVMFINLGSYYVVGLPIACLLAFKFHWFAQGLWMGLICGLVAQCSSLFLITRLNKWTTP